MWSSPGHLSWNALTCDAARKVHGVEFSRVSHHTTGVEWTLMSLWTWESPRSVLKLFFLRTLFYVNLDLYTTCEITNPVWGEGFVTRQPIMASSSQLAASSSLGSDCRGQQWFEPGTPVSAMLCVCTVWKQRGGLTTDPSILCSSQ